MSTQLPTTMSFSDEQSMLLDTAVEFCKNSSPIAKVRDLLLDERGFDADVWAEITGLGWHGIAVDEEFGGSGLGLAALVPVVEAMGRRLLAAPFVSSQIAIQMLQAGGTDEQRAHWLPKLADGAIATVAMTEEDGNWDLAEIQAREDGGTLSGNKALVLDADVADLVLVSVQHKGAVALALVPGTQVPKNQLTRETVLDETRRSYSMLLNGIDVTEDQLITGAAAQRALGACEQTAWLLHSADACGGLDATIELVVDYLNTRTQFGHKIGSYQSLKHPTVDMLLNLERARSHVYHAASLIASDASDTARTIALRMAKADSGDAYIFAADRAIQFHGGFGFTYECDAQLYLRRALWLQYQFGDTPHHSAALQPLLLDVV